MNFMQTHFKVFRVIFNSFIFSFWRSRLKYSLSRVVAGILLCKQIVGNGYVCVDLRTRRQQKQTTKT